MSIKIDLLKKITDLLNNYHHVCLDKRIEIILALSGGLDSVVLLDLLSEFIKQNDTDKIYSIKSVYIDHQLQPDSKLWLEFTRNLSKNYNIPFVSYTIDICSSSGKGIEAAAREARYQCFTECVDKNNKILLTAHHLNDQAETFLLQLIRGAGPKGLSAMPKIKKFSQGYHLRPLLDCSRQDLHHYAVKKNLTWVEDKTNLDLKFERNYIRHAVLPVIEQHWPNFIQRVAVSATNCAEQERVLSEYLNADYVLLVESIKVANVTHTTLKIDMLVNMSIAKQQLILRYWLQEHNITMPGRKIINHIITDGLLSDVDSNPQINIGNYIVTRYHNNLFIISNKKEQFDLPNINTAVGYELGQDVILPEQGIKITSKFITGDSIDTNGCFNKIDIPSDKKLTIKFRQGGERCRPVGRNGSVSIKKLMQENKIPPWQRYKIPLLCVDDDIAAVIGVSICSPYANNKQHESGWVVVCEYL